MGGSSQPHRCASRGTPARRVTTGRPCAGEAIDCRPPSRSSHGHPTVPGRALSRHRVARAAATPTIAQLSTLRTQRRTRGAACTSMHSRTNISRDGAQNGKRRRRQSYGIKARNLPQIWREVWSIFPREGGALSITKHPAGPPRTFLRAPAFFCSCSSITLTSLFSTPPIHLNPTRSSVHYGARQS